MKLTRLSAGVMAGLLALASACGDDTRNDLHSYEPTLTVVPENRTVQEGGSLQLAAEYVDENGNATNVTADAAWSSSNPDVAEFEGARLNAVGAGETVVTAEHEGLETSTSVFVDAAVEQVEISPQSLSVAAGTTGSIDATGIASDNTKRPVGGQVGWASSNQDAATVDDTGTVTAIGEEDQTIVSASYGGQVIAEVEVNVVTDPLDTLEIAIGNGEMLVGTAQPIGVTGTFDNGHEQALPLAWEITDQTLADDEAEGDVVGFEGGALVALQSGTATFEGAFVPGEDPVATSNSVEVEVLAEDLVPDSIEVAGPPAAAVDGEPVFFGANGDFGDAGTFPVGSLVLWQGSDDTTLRVRGPEGTPRSDGDVDVSAVWPLEEGDPIIGQHSVSVTDAPASGLTINDESDEGGEQLGAVAEFGSTTQEVGSAVYWSSDDACAFVDNAPARSGEVTKETDCDATITARYRDQEDTINAADIGAEE